MKQMFVGIVGYSKSGKSVISRELNNLWGFKQVNFADSLKRGLSISLRVPLEWFIEPSEKEKEREEFYGASARQVMQKIGTEGFRNLIGQEVWVDVWERYLAEITPVPTRVVVDDIRFLEELSRLRSLNAKVIGVVRPNIIPMSHESERNIKNLLCLTDYTLKNDKSLSVFKEEIKSFFSRELDIS